MILNIGYFTLYCCSYISAYTHFGEGWTLDVDLHVAVFLFTGISGQTQFIDIYIVWHCNS